VMPPHPLFSVHEAKAMVEYMLNVKDTSLSTAPLQGSYKPALPEDDPGRGSVVIRAVYTDKGVKDLPPLTTESMTVLRSTRLGVATADVQSGVVPLSGRGSAGVLPRNKSYIGFKGVDLAGVKKAELAARADARSGNVGGTIEVRLDSPTGPMVGQAVVNAPGGGASGPTATDIQAAGGGGRGRGRGGPAPISIDLKESRGVHDVYFVFRNDRATGAQPLMTVSTVRFAME
jgi:cytochrome c